MSVVVVVVRHPDSGTEVSTFVDGAAVDARVITVDPGSGWSREDWAELRDSAMQQAGSDAAQSVVAEAFDGYDDSEFITDGGCEVDQNNVRLLIAAARDLASDDGDNAEYDRALVELVSTFVAGDRDHARRVTENAILGTEHHIEEAAKVYLRWDDVTQRWVIDESCAPEWGPLDGYPNGAVAQECQCTDRAEHEEVLSAAQLTALPNLDELAEMIADRARVQVR